MLWALLLAWLSVAPAEAQTVVGGIPSPFSLANSSAYTAIVGSVCGAATECYVGIAADGKIPAGTINAAKHRIEILLRGIYGANGATDTVTLQVKACTVSACGSGTVIVLAATGAVLPGAAVTTQGWQTKVDCNVFTAGASGTLQCAGFSLFSLTGLTALQADDMVQASTVTVDTTVDEFISLGVKWNNSSINNTLTTQILGIHVY
jgi:hypothetical protein